MSSDGEENEDYFYDEYDDDGFEEANEEAGADSMSEPEDFDILSPGIDDLPAKNPYDVMYKVRTTHEITEMQQKEVKKIQTLLEVPASTAAILLRHYSWNSEKLQEQFWTDPSLALSQAGLSPPTESHPLPSTSQPSSPRRFTRGVARAPLPSPTKQARSLAINPFECPICCCDYPQSEVASKTLALGCGHRFCRDCWGEYLNGKVKGEGESGKIQCMESGCQRIVREEVVDGIVNQDVSQRYHELLNTAFVADSPNLRWCPHPSCEYAVECSQAPPRMLNQIVPTVHCNCGRDFCFGCGYADDHRPVLCRIVKLWEKKCADDSETANWLQANTKECQKCQSTIEKNGGCNHMTCKKCKWEFCWVCMGPWSEHGNSFYQCNRFDEKTGVEARDVQARSRHSLERYLHYFNRWANHQHSAKLDADLYKDTEKKMEQMQNSSNLSWIEVQFAKQAVDVVIQARITLKWSYAMAYYLKKNNMTELFEDNQRDLERAVESLGYLLQENLDTKSIVKLRQDITNQSAYVQKRHDILLDDTLRGYLERRWEMTVDI
ncbi:ariadne-1, partial [Tremellales sp. Uapishka_1]